MQLSVMLHANNDSSSMDEGRKIAYQYYIELVKNQFLQSNGV